LDKLNIGKTELIVKKKNTIMITDGNQACFAKKATRCFQEATLHRGPLDCLRNRQADPPWINRESKKSEDFF
jgi:hypothetical protein